MATVEEGAQYADHIIADVIPSSRWTKYACERFVSDLEQQGTDQFPYVFDIEAAQAVLDFCELCKHSKGVWAGQPFVPEPWEVFILINLFGWIHRYTGLRRFRTAYIEVARKNGKTTLVAVIGLYMLLADNEPGAEVYAAATKRDQAKLAFNEAKRMVKKSPDLSKHAGVYENNIHDIATESKFEPLGADANNLDGLNSHCNLVDELHAHKTRDLWDVLETGTGARTQSMQIAITTAGYNQNGICYEQREYLTKILQDVINDESYFGIIYTVEEYDLNGDEIDDWRNEKVWIKANPNWGISVFPDDIRRLAQKAMETPAAQNNFKTKRLNIWTQQETRWLDVDDWNKSDQPFDLDELIGERCYGGLDLSSKLDLSCFALAFPPTADRDFWVFIYWFWIPKDNIMLRVKRDKVPFDAWARDGHLTATPGNIVDYKYIRKEINAAAALYEIGDIGYDPDNATMLCQQLTDEDGIEMVEFRQGIRSLSEPSKEFEAMIKSRSIAHGGHPVMRWCVSNVAVKTDAQGNYMPAKDKSTDRIDGVAASVIAIGRAMRHTSEEFIDAEGISFV
jgi:phage terminase large subunit-like protein